MVEEGRLVGVLAAGDVALTAAVHALRTDLFPTPEVAVAGVVPPQRAPGSDS